LYTHPSKTISNPQGKRSSFKETKLGSARKFSDFLQLVESDRPHRILPEIVEKGKTRETYFDKEKTRLDQGLGGRPDKLKDRYFISGSFGKPQENLQIVAKYGSFRDLLNVYDEESKNVMEQKGLITGR
jgi:hypothetical protein